MNEATYNIIVLRQIKKIVLVVILNNVKFLGICKNNCSVITFVL